ncbi:MAG: PilZ domain-containing protein [Planctomycetota bacterium]
MIDGNRIIEPRPGSGNERRRFARMPLARACKIKPARGVRYRPAITSDVSSGGVCLAVDGAADLDVGAQVDLAVSWHGHPTVTHGETIPARVVRVEPGSERTTIALAFDTPIPISSAIKPPRAA